MSSPKRIVVTGDIFRVSQDSQRLGIQKGNIEWLYQLIRPSLEMMTSLPVHPLYYKGGKGCIVTRLYRARALDLTFESWVSLYESKPSPRDLGVIDEELGDALVIGFELPEFTRLALDKLDIPYLDFTIHPVRFMDDIIFGVRSNLVGLANALRKWVITENEIRVYAGLARATLVRLPPLPQCPEGGNAALFCGQTTDDKVLIRNGRLMQAEDFLPQFAEMCNRHEKVFLKPHPLSPCNPVILCLTRLFPNTEVVDTNFYHLLARGGLTHVYSITSSTSIEAAYFDKQGQHLSLYPYIFNEFTSDGGAYLTIDSEIYSQSFWAQIMKLLNVPLSQSHLVDVKKVPSRVRRSLRMFWGADIFERI